MDRAVRGLGNALLSIYGSWRARRYEVKNTIVIACTGRGGSTWLAQILSALPKHHLLWEPLHWRTNPDCQKFGFGRPVYIRPDGHTPEQYDYLLRILTGRTLPSAINSSRYFQPADLLQLQAYIAKFVTANMMLPWLVNAFGVRAVYMLRHPCAVVSSQITHGAWEDVGKSFCFHETLFEDYPHLASVYDRIESHEEILAFNWAVQNFVPLKHPAPHDWCTVTYEQLVRSGLAEVERLFRYLGEPMPPNVSVHFHTASATTVEKSNVTQNKDPLTGWTERLDAKQIDTILQVVHDTGITLYDERLEPDEMTFDFLTSHDARSTS